MTTSGLYSRHGLTMLTESMTSPFPVHPVWTIALDRAVLLTFQSLEIISVILQPGLSTHILVLTCPSITT